MKRKTLEQDPITPMIGEMFDLSNHIGLTKREHFAAMAMQGYVVNGTIGIDKKALAEWSVGMADALINALNKGA